MQEAGRALPRHHPAQPAGSVRPGSPAAAGPAGQAPDLGTWHRVNVHRDCHVQFERVLYSAPFTLVGKLLWLRATDAAVALFEDYRHVATHPRGQRGASA
jgi:hypothetical protein